MRFEWTDQRQEIFLDRYALRTNGDVLEDDIAQMWNRVATSVSNTMEESTDFEYVMSELLFLPAGRILSGAGSGQHSSTWYNCFVLGLDPLDKSRGKDSRDSILNTICRMVEITCRGGGVGINWSALRPDTSKILGVHGESSGPIGWMRGADALADQVRQGGSRTAALMFMLNDWHPDILKFVSLERFRRANFSVSISDEFMMRLERNEDWGLFFPITSDPAYDLLWNGDINQWTSEGRAFTHTKADINEIWAAICRSALASGSPGLVFMDECNRQSSVDAQLICTNPCGEQPLPEYGSCNLGALNLVAHSDANGTIDRKELAHTIQVAVAFLDNIIDKSPPLYSEIDSVQRLYRRIGLGTMGLADLLILNKVRYGSQESLSFISELYAFIRDEAFAADAELASKRGAAPMFSRMTMNAPIMKSLGAKAFDLCNHHGLRNMSILTQAPTGTTSILAGVSSSIEPIFAPEYTRRDATGEYMVSHPLFRGARGAHHVTAYDVSPEEHVRVQACLQKLVDASISKTVNLPPCSSEDDVSKIFRLAYDMKCKGITIFQGGSSDDILSCQSCSI